MNQFDNEKMFTVKCSRGDFEHLQELFESGELNRRLGVEVTDMGITSTEISTESIILSQWLKGIIQPSWQIIQSNTAGSNLTLIKQSKLNNNQTKYCSISCKRYCKSENNIDGNAIELIVKIKLTQSQGEMDIKVIAKPCRYQSFLPQGLKLILLVDSDILAEVEARSADKIIHYGLTGDIGDNFSVKLALGDVNIKEDFVI
ncbi:hypothetical protein NIES267_71170 [Calothrix parasitica NIES-267]|uniref:DUF1822 domain-containing protein n=1 Tax=Calothrix parasitica NIES-267 TaxID=1973488 RepID=A0A1Z4M263_9CYAN|nr:hypothetical protein NIES267_71170 [Calothrix parasitica NIES-267]